MLQKSSSTSKSGNRLKALQRRLDLRNHGDTKERISEATTIKSRLNNINISKEIAEFLKRFLSLTEKDNENRVLKRLTS